MPHRTLGHDWMTGCLKNIPEHMNWWEEFESSHDAPQAPHIDGAGGQSGRIGFLLAPWFFLWPAMADLIQVMKAT